MIFLSKDKTLAIPLLKGLLRFWPFANCEKETLFLTELQEVLEVSDLKAVAEHIPRIMKRLVRCIKGTHL